MAYQSLYRRYRPRRFSDVRGQEHVVRALRNAVRDERVGHAYLFSGPRGTGKTSTARILAKALNCEHLDGGEPDGTCDSCLAIDAGTSYDVQELDAASNNKVEDVRDLIARVALGSPGRTKVYILDEVHMLTAAASASLLKTLEEPPDHVVFVLATTDPQKVLDTIRSRTQHFEFHLLSAEELSEHVAWVIHDAGLDLPDDVIEYVVRQGKGSARDTLSSLDQVAAAGGVLDRGDAVIDLLDAIAAGDAGRSLVAVADAVSSGRDPRVLGEAVLARLRDIFLLRMGASTDHLPPGDIDKVQAWADQLGDRATTRALEEVGDALLEMRQAPDPRIPLEVALVKITRVAGDTSIDGLAARVAALEAAVASGAAASPAAAPAAPVAPSPAAPARPAATSAATPVAPTPAPAAPSPSAGPASSSGRPADIARAQLAAQRAQRGGGGSRPGPSRPASASPAAAPESSPPPSEPAPGSAPAADPTSTGAEAAPTTTAATTGGSLPGPDDLTALWTESVLPGLGGLAKAMYSAGHFTEVQGSTAIFALPNEVHRQKCEQKLGEVEAALSARIGSPVKLRLVVEADGSAEGTTADGAPAAPAPADEDHLGGADVHDLDDAPDAPSGGLAALTEAFPGSELVE